MLICELSYYFFSDHLKCLFDIYMIPQGHGQYQMQAHYQYWGSCEGQKISFENLTQFLIAK